jgi:hypothetical protein
MQTSKTKGARTVDYHWGSYRWFGDEGTREFYTPVTYGADTITYDLGKKTNGHWPWKECVHTNEGSMSHGGATSFEVLAPWNGSTWYESYVLLPRLPGDLPGVPPVPASFEAQALKKCLDQVDLNTSDAVLLYSGVLQAVPLLGSVTKFNSIMRGVQQHITKSLRKKPFTTVIKDLIQADFIDRFVISPTLADIRKFQDATDYVLRVIETARQRNSHKFALSSDVTSVFSEESSSGYYNGPSGSDAYYAWNEKVSTGATCKAFILLEAEYNMTAVDPLKVWAQRVGLTRPLDSVWDLVPFSFVVDYFTRAGDFISHLSDEMSSIDGLKGKITSIHDVWHTVNSYSRCVRRPGGRIQGPFLPGGTELMYIVHDPSPAISTKEAFRRFRVGDQWERCMQLMREPENYLSVNLDLSLTRQRTLAELVIQAKL